MGPSSLLALVKLARNHGRRHILAAAIDRDRRRWRGELARQVRQADRATDADRRAAARDRADHAFLALAELAVDDRIAVPRDRARRLVDLETGELALEPLRLLRAQRGRADEVALELDGPGQAGLE